MAQTDQPSQATLSSAGLRGRPSRARLFEQLRTEVADMRARFGGLPSPKEAEQIWAGIWFEEVHNSTAIEGNTLALKEVEVLLRSGKTTGGRQFRDYLEVKGYGEAARWVYGQALDSGGWDGSRLLSITEIREVHRIAMRLAWEYEAPAHALPAESPGNWRQHTIDKFASGMTPPPWTEVPHRMTDWVRKAIEIQADDVRLMDRLASLHADFERLHPFLEGNGRAGRLLLNLMLVRLGYPPAAIYVRDRPAYLNALARADTGDPRPLAELITRSVHGNLVRLVYPAIAGEVKLVPLEALANDSLSVAALRQAAQRGRLQAIQGPDRVWRSTKKWAADYAKNKYAGLRGPRARSTYRAVVTSASDRRNTTATR